MSKDSTKTQPAISALPRMLDSKYRLDACIGKGGMGIVYRGMNSAIQRPVAIKILRPEYSTHPSVTERFLREARAAASIRGMHIVEILDFGMSDDGTTFFVMELLEGISLADLIRREKRIPFKRFLTIASQICAGLNCAHKEGIIHRDLKPANIFLVDQGEEKDFVKILDFGVAKLLGEAEADLTKTGMLLGTVDYMAPEQIRGEPVDPRTDIYALGVVIYRALTGTRPFSSEGGVPAMVYHHINTEPESMLSRAPKAQIPEILDRIVMKCMSKKREQRFPDMPSLRKALLHALENPSLHPVTDNIKSDDEDPDMGEPVSLASDWFFDLDTYNRRKKLLEEIEEDSDDIIPASDKADAPHHKQLHLPDPAKPLSPDSFLSEKLFTSKSHPGNVRTEKYSADSIQKSRKQERREISSSDNAPIPPLLPHESKNLKSLNTDPQFMQKDSFIENDLLPIPGPERSNIRSHKEESNKKPFLSDSSLIISEEKSDEPEYLIDEEVNFSDLLRQSSPETPWYKKELIEKKHSKKTKILLMLSVFVAASLVTGIFSQGNFGIGLPGRIADPDFQSPGDIRGISDSQQKDLKQKDKSPLAKSGPDKVSEESSLHHNFGEGKRGIESDNSGLINASGHSKTRKDIKKKTVSSPVSKAEEPGMIVVNASVTGARVFVNGNPSGQAPATIIPDSFDPVIIRVTARGHAPFESEVYPTLQDIVVMARLQQTRTRPAPAAETKKAVPAQKEKETDDDDFFPMDL